MADLPSYQYEGLESNGDGFGKGSTSFRLITLHAGERDDEISCTLSQHKLDSATEYEAISYVWGDSKDTVDIVCSGQRLVITKNLHAALQHFRGEHQARTVWADAICIDQTNLDERGAQVAVMNKIYSQARRVLIWLGEETESTSEALDALQRLEVSLPAITADTRIGDRGPEDSQGRPQMWHSLPERSWYHIGELFLRPWFQRVWVIQEVAMAQEARLYNGIKSIAWSTFAVATRGIIYYNLGYFLGLYTVSWDSRILRSISRLVLVLVPEESRAMPFSKLVLQARHFRSTDPRDKLYALLALSNNLDSWIMPHGKPDYSLAIADLFIQFTKRQLLSGSLIYLSATNYNGVYNDYNLGQITLPSWALDLSRSADSTPNFEAMDFYNARGATTACSSFHPNNVLLIRGRRISAIKRLGPMWPAEMDGDIGYSYSTTKYVGLTSSAAMQILIAFFGSCHRVAFGDDFAPNEGKFNSQEYFRFCEALCADLNLDNENPPLKSAVESLSKVYLLLLRNLDLLHPQTDSVSYNEELSRTTEYISRFLSVCCGSRYFCSDTFGRLGWAPRKAKVGDEICVFYGAKIPYVLRPREDGKYELIGGCYLQGCMQGEVMVTDAFLEEEFAIV